ncbi:MAG: hypothetical protein EBT02_17410 [Planctomycetia bacterium]|nr:hypothetical protein [Planctomycetia bacterium]
MPVIRAVFWVLFDILQIILDQE